MIRFYPNSASEKFGGHLMITHAFIVGLLP